MKTDAQLDALEAAATSWAGTPFCENSKVKGAGVSCHYAVWLVYVEALWMPLGINIPTAPPQHCRTRGESLIARWLETDGVSYFRPVKIEEIEPGDLLGFKVGHCLHHIAIQLRGGRIFHAVETTGAGIAPSLPKAWAKRLVRAWRPTW